MSGDIGSGEYSGNKYRKGNKMSKFHRQCKLENGNANYTAWIPEEYAIKGNIIKIDDMGEYTVVNIGQRMETDKVNKQSDRVHRGIFGSIK